MSGILDYYDGAYGPTIRLEADSVEALHQILALFARLAATERTVGSLNDLSSFEIVGTLEISLESVEIVRGPRLARSDENPRHFHWQDTKKGWRTSTGLMEGLIEVGRGHQYFANEETDHVLIEVSFGESSNCE